VACFLSEISIEEQRYVPLNETSQKGSTKRIQLRHLRLLSRLLWTIVSQSFYGPFCVILNISKSIYTKVFFLKMAGAKILLLLSTLTVRAYSWWFTSWNCDGPPYLYASFHHDIKGLRSALGFISEVFTLK
jgi:uncharacterized protein YhhL (DUF1145 family)